jgi:FtsH-binding integral membrane protein
MYRSREIHARPIAAAVATVGISDRISFLRKTYAHLGIALIAFAALTVTMMLGWSAESRAASRWALGGAWSWLLVLGGFMLVGYVGERLAWSERSRGLQYAGLAVCVVAQSLIVQPLLWSVMATLGAADALRTIAQAAAITIAIFIGLTLTVFVTRKDFSFLRGFLVVAGFACLGVIVASLLLGFSLGVIFCAAVILLVAGFILYQTSLVMSHFPPSAHVAAALMLFSSIATMFWYVLQLMTAVRRD